MRSARAVAGFGVVALALMAAVPPAGAEELAENQVLRIGNGIEPQTLDPQLSENVQDSNIERDLYEGLLTLDGNGRVRPGVAESWSVSPDGLVYTFKLRDDAKWSNGAPVTAEDFAWSWRRMVDPATGSKYAFLYYPIKNAEDIVLGRNTDIRALGVKAIDAHTFEVTLKAPTAYFPSLICHTRFLPLNGASVDKFGPQFTRAGNLVSNGAFMLQEWTPQSRIVLVKNPNYWDSAHSKLTEVDYFPIENENEELKRYRAGELDLTSNVPADQVEFIRQNLPNELKVTPFLGTYFYGFNLEQPPFKGNPKLRRAIALVIDRQAITDRILKTGEKPLYSWVPPGIPDYHPQEMSFAGEPMEQRIAEAKALYQQAGYGPDKPLTIELRYNTSENHKKIAIAVAAMLNRALGIKLSLINTEYKVLLDDIKEKKVTQMFRGSWIGDYVDPNTFAEFLQSDAPLSGTGWHNPDYDRLVKTAAVTVDPARRLGMLEQAEKLVVTDLPVMPIYSYVKKVMVKPYVVGYEPNVLGWFYSKDIHLLKQGS